jgi:protein-tyrosine phosphatase
MWSWTEKARESITDATKGLTETLEKTGEAITQAATKPKKPKNPEGDAEFSEQHQGDERQQQQPIASSDNSSEGGPKLTHVDKDKFFNNIKMGWSSVVENTKRSIDATVEAVEKQSSRLEHSFPFSKKGGYYKRDPNLPLDVEALRDAEVVYVTDRIITMSHPAMASSVHPAITGERKLAAIGHLLQRRHDGRFLIFNLSEVEYDVEILNDQVMMFSFPGSPSPPLGLLLKLLLSMENWMKADDRNVAVVHCLTGKGRTSTVLAAFLCWMGEAGFGDIHAALAYIAKCKQMKPDELTIPSQRRYASYFKNMLDGVRPSQPPLLLKRIIMSEAPRVRKRKMSSVVFDFGMDTFKKK